MDLTFVFSPALFLFSHPMLIGVFVSVSGAVPLPPQAGFHCSKTMMFTFVENFHGTAIL